MGSGVSLVGRGCELHARPGHNFRGAPRVAPWPLALPTCFYRKKLDGSWCHGVVLFLVKSYEIQKKMILMILIDDIDDSTFKDLSIHINSHQFTSIHIWNPHQFTSLKIHLTRTQPLAAHLPAATMVPLGQAKRWPKVIARFSPLSRSVHVKSTTFPLEITGNGWKW